MEIGTQYYLAATVLQMTLDKQMLLIQCFCFVLFCFYNTYYTTMKSMFSNMLTLEEVALTSHNIAFIKRYFCSFPSQQASQV